MGQQTFEFLLLAMSALAVIVFVALYYVRAGYGMFHTPKWGLSVNNKLGWVLMEAPVFLVMLYLWWNSSVRFDAAPFLFFLLFELHYFQRSFIFPFLMKGKSRMPLAIMLMGVVFNVLNGLMQGEWLFYLAPEGLYTDAWLSTPSILYLASALPLPGILAVFLFNMTMPVTLWAAARVMPGAKGFAFGLMTFALFLGFLPSWLGWPSLLAGPAGYGLMALTSLALLWFPLRKGAARC